MKTLSQEGPGVVGDGRDGVVVTFASEDQLTVCSLEKNMFFSLTNHPINNILDILKDLKVGCNRDSNSLPKEEHFRT